MLRDGLLLTYCAVVGFVAAGIAASFYRMVTHEPARFTVLGHTWLGLAVSFFFIAVSGPAIVVDHALNLWRENGRSARWLFAGFTVAALWSLCSGILVLGVVVAVQGSLA